MLAEELNRVHFKLSPVGGDPTGAAAVGSVPTAHNYICQATI